jgi:hypothetical protein
MLKNSATANNTTTNNHQQTIQEQVTSPKENNLTHSNAKNLGNNRDKVNGQFSFQSMILV